MANDFSFDARCKALWRFESGALDTDSIGTNTLVPGVSAPTEDAVNFKEGACAVNFASASSQYYRIADADLDAGFPLKSGDTTKKITVCYWVKATSFPSGNNAVLSKYDSVAGKRGLLLGFEATTNKSYLLWGYNGGASIYIWTPTAALSTGVWYHFAWIINGVAKTAKLRIYNDATGVATTYSTSFANELNVSDTPLLISAVNDTSKGAYINGKSDEIVIFNNDNLTDADIDKIRAGLFPFGYIGEIPLTFTPQAETYGNHSYEGEIPLTLTPQSNCGGPHAPYEGYTLLRFTPLADYEEYGPGDTYEVPSTTGGFKLGGAGTIVHETPETLAVIGSGGLELGGEGTIEFGTPETLEVIGSGGFVLDGAGEISFEPPKEYVHIGSGGLRLGGAGIISFVLPSEEAVDELAIIGSGGLVLGGTGIIEFFDPDVLAIIGSGGFKLGGFRVPETTVVQFIDPADLTLVASTTTVAFEMGGEGIITHFKPGAESVFAVPMPHPAADTALKLGGAGGITFIDPQIMAVIAEGGLLLGAEPIEEDETYETWALTGQTFEPAIYSGFGFNSFCIYRGRAYGAKDAGIYLLEGDDDAGEAIHPGVRIGPHNYGRDQEKRLRSIRLGDKSNGARVKITTGAGDEGYFDSEDGRVAVSRDLQDRTFVIDIQDFEELSHLEIVSLVLSKR